MRRPRNRIVPGWLRSTATAPAPAPASNQPRAFRGVLRSTSSLVAAVLAILMLSAVVPPLVADQSDRAVVNAPVTLLTAPISGDVHDISIRAGEAVTRGQIIARLSNARVDRTTLITLESKAAETKGRLQAAGRRRESSAQYLAALDRSLQEQTRQSIAMFTQQIAELKARSAATASSGQEKKANLERQTSMVARNVASPEMMKPAQQQYTTALHQGEAETAKLNQKITQLDGLTKGVYVGDDLAGLATLAQKRRDIEFDAQRLAIEEGELEQSLRDQQNLLVAERERLVSLASAEVEAPTAGDILNVGAGAGRHVSAGDALATLVNCERTVVVAIFSYRQAQALAVGSRVEITGGERFSGRYGTVQEILPKAGDKLDDLYAVPFPQTERRELYVLVSPDRDASDGRSTQPATAAGAACSVGQWVTVSRANGWVPSMSVVWRSVRTQLGELLSGPFTSARAGS